MAVAGVGMAKRHGLWAEIQRERARQERIRQREFREFQRAGARTVREAAKAERDRKRQAAAGERERKKLYVEDRKAEAAAMAEDVGARLAELDGLLKAGIRDRPVVTFASLDGLMPTRRLTRASLASYCLPRYGSNSPRHRRPG
jgi:restriction system protein